VADRTDAQLSALFSEALPVPHQIGPGARIRAPGALPQQVMSTVTASAARCGGGGIALGCAVAAHRPPDSPNITRTSSTRGYWQSRWQRRLPARSLAGLCQHSRF